MGNLFLFLFFIILMSCPRRPPGFAMAGQKALGFWLGLSLVLWEELDSWAKGPRGDLFKRTELGQDRWLQVFLLKQT